MKPHGVVNPQRSYDRTRRSAAAALTRTRILNSARELFSQRGYAGTSMRAIAEGAGVSVKTVEAAFSTKTNVLKVLIDVGIVGDDEPVAMAQRPVVAEMVAERDPERYLGLHAALVAEVSRRLGSITRVLVQAAPSDPELRAVLNNSNANRLHGARMAMETLATKAELRVPLAKAVDIVWALMDPAVYELFTQDRQWSHDEFITWLSDTYERLLLP